MNYNNRNYRCRNIIRKIQFFVTQVFKMVTGGNSTILHTEGIPSVQAVQAKIE